MKVALGADHRGYALKEALKTHLAHSGNEIADVGAHAIAPTDDYPDYAYPAAMLVANGEAERAVLLCGSGTGMAIAANKVAGVRAVEGSTESHVRAARRDDDVNVLALSADEHTPESAVAVLDAFLAQSYEPSARHERRLDEITAIERDERSPSSHE